MTRQHAPTLPTPHAIWLKGKLIWGSRSCGDCPNGPPCRCFAGEFLDTLAIDEREAVAVFLRDTP